MCFSFAEIEKVVCRTPLDLDSHTVCESKSMKFTLN